MLDAAFQENQGSVNSTSEMFPAVFGPHFAERFNTKEDFLRTWHLSQAHSLEIIETVARSLAKRYEDPYFIRKLMVIIQTITLVVDQVGKNNKGLKSVWLQVINESYNDLLAYIGPEEFDLLVGLNAVSTTRVQINFYDLLQGWQKILT